MRNVSEKTLKTALVNFKCVGYFGKCFRALSSSERSKAIDEMIIRGWLREEPFSITPEGDKVVKENLNLCQY